MSPHTIVLSGQWSRSVDGRAIDYVAVPGSYPPLGQCLLGFEFESTWPARPGDGERYFLVTDGVLSSAAFALNGQPLGTAGPWATYRFELPIGLLRQGLNTITALVRDISESFGPTPGRRFDAGLVRNIWVERQPATFLASMHFHAELNGDLSRADCTVTVEIDGPESEAVELALYDSQTNERIAVPSASAGRPARFAIEHPRLWSPRIPHLYTLVAEYPGQRNVLVEHVGFRRIEARGQDFFLNNQRLILKGVCRHEFNFGSGYSPSNAEVRREMERIKHAGFNYVRLVHSPHGSVACRIAAEIGLLVSEEPGTCFHDLGDEAIAAPAVEALRRTILRDRNCPSVFAWLIYNECNPNSDYAVRIAKMCRELDPGRLLGMADCSGKHDEIKAMVAAGNLSFYGINVYSSNPRDYSDRMKLFTDRPIVFTEWGGWTAVGNPRMLQLLCDGMVIHSHEKESIRMAGCAFWAWADYEEHSRPQPATIEGWTMEGLVDRHGRPKPDLAILSEMCFAMDHPPVAAPPAVEVMCPAPRRNEKWQPIELDEIAIDQAEPEKAIDAMRLGRHSYDRWIMEQNSEMLPLPRFGRLMVDGIDFHCRDHRRLNRPLLLGKGNREVTIPIGRRVTAIAVLGHVAFGAAYPASAIYSVHHGHGEAIRELGTAAGEYELIFQEGAEVVPLRHGLEILRANEICRWWTPAPRAPHTRPAVRSVIDPTNEVLRMDLWEFRLPGPRHLKSIRWKLSDEQAILLMHAISVETVD